MAVLTDDGEADLGVPGWRLSEVDTAPILPFVPLVHVVQGQGGRVSDCQEIPALVKNLLILPMRRHLGVFSSDVVTEDKRQY